MAQHASSVEKKLGLSVTIEIEIERFCCVFFSEFFQINVDLGLFFNGLFYRIFLFSKEKARILSGKKPKLKSPRAV